MTEVIYQLTEERTVQLLSKYHCPTSQCTLTSVIIARSALKSFQEVAIHTVVVFTIFWQGANMNVLPLTFHRLRKSKLHHENISRILNIAP